MNQPKTLFCLLAGNIARVACVFSYFLASFRPLTMQAIQSKPIQSRLSI